ncbi:MAG: hypothetical protein OXH76_16390 [Boseongicola sp.]|nr:hypothetical protein [Boseongicola sp.]
MNSNLKLLPAGLLMAVLALAGCGGGGGDSTTTTPPPEPKTCPAGQALDTSTDECVKTAASAEEEAAAEARVAMAKKLRGILAVDAVAVATTAPASSTPSDDVVTALGKANDADDGAGKEGDAQVMVYDNKGPMTKASADATDLTTFDAKLVMGSGFATGSAEIKEHDNPSTVRGSYNGATGGYVCSADGCTSQRTKNGILLTGGTWTFQPDAGQKFNVEDADYVSYGWWLDEGITGDAAAKAGAWYVVTQGTPITTQQVTDASGTATYSGQAVGKAAYYHSLGGASNIGGHFTADAELMADFDDANGMLSGSITGFDIGGVNPGWSVELMKHAIDGTGIAADAQTKWTVDGTAGDAGGSWTAAFYGKPSDEHQPSGVAGGFEASYESDGYMVGAFEAER